MHFAQMNLYANKNFQPISFFQSLLTLCAINIASVKDDSTGRPFISVNMHGVSGSWLFDTGASVTLISLKEFRKISPDNRPPRMSPITNLSGAGGESLNTHGIYNLKLTINGRTLVHPVYVASNLSSPAILGIDAIKAFGLLYSPFKHSFSFESQSKSVHTVQGVAPSPSPDLDSASILASLSTTKTVTIPALTSLSLSVSTVSSLPYRPPADMLGLAHIGTSDLPYLNGGPGLVKTDRIGEVTVRLNNCSPTDLLLPKGSIIGFLESLRPSSIRQVDQDLFIAAIEKVVPAPTPPITLSDKAEFLKNLQINVPPSERPAYIDLLLRNHDVFSKDKNDLGCATNAKHTIHLKNNLPIYVKQFPIPESYRQQLDLQVKEWLKMGVIIPTNSPYNSPIFIVPKKDGSPRYVLDFRKLNANSHTDKYSMKTVEECIGDIGRSGSTIFSTLDLSSGFWQLPLDPNSQKFTAFTVQGSGQFQWTRTSQGLHSAPSQYQRLMELTVKGLENIIVYIDDLLVHSSEHDHHRHSLQLLFDRLRRANLKLNLPKCHFGSDNVTYLGFRLTPQGILPGSDKLAAVRNATPPTNVHQIRQFLGLANFFRTHIRNFSLISSPLNLLTRKDTVWRGGILPPAALRSFKELQSALCSEPVVNYPRKHRPYALIVDAASGNDKNEGGLGAVLCQADEKGELHVIAYASRSLSKHEKNYTPFLIEMTACTWGIDHFSVYLKGRKFTLYTDHKPLEKLSTVHTKTLNRLQQAMNEHDFVICHKPGLEMPADFLSRNVASISSVLDTDLKLLQSQDVFASSLIDFIKLGTLPADPLRAHYVQKIAPSCFFEKDVLWRRISRHNMPHRNVLILPLVLADELIHDSHSSLLSGHEGITRTKERILQSYFWPNMEDKIGQHVTSCERCQARRTTDRPRPPLLTPMPQCTALNQRIHIDLMGGLRTSSQGKNYVLCMTDAFTKYAEICAIPNKEAATVARALFERWICRFGCPIEFTSDNGKEFCNKLTEELFKLLQIKHSHTTPYHPQCNAQAEVQNKVIAKYLASFVDKTTLDWPLYIAPMAFAYNTALHRSIKSTPFFLTYGIDARLPSLPDPDLNRYYGQSDVAEWYKTLQHCRQLATQHNLQASNYMQSQFNKKASPYNYTIGQLVWIDIRNFLGLNRKLSPNWEGPYAISRTFDTGVVEIIYKNNKKIRVNVARIKPYIAPFGTQAREVTLPPTPPGPRAPHPAPLVPRFRPQLPNPVLDPHFGDPSVSNSPDPVFPPNFDNQLLEQYPDPVFPPNNYVLRPDPNVLPRQPAPVLAPNRYLSQWDPNVNAPVPRAPAPVLAPNSRTNNRLVLPPTNRSLQQQLIPSQQTAGPALPPATRHPTPSFDLPLRQMGQTLGGNFPSPSEMGQHRQRVFVPQISLPLAPPALPPAAAGDNIIPDNMRITRSVRASNQLQLHPPLAALHKESPFTVNPAVGSGPSLVSDEYGLPIVKPGFKTPQWITKRRKFLKNLTPSARNLLLTGDPLYAYDNVPYDAEWYNVTARPAPAVVDVPLPPVPPPPVAHPRPVHPPDNFRYIQFETPPRHLLTDNSSDSSQSPPPSPAEPGPQQCLRPRPSTANSAALDAASTLMERASLNDRPGNYWLRSSPTAPAATPSSSSSGLSRLTSWSRNLASRARIAFEETADDAAAVLLPPLEPSRVPAHHPTGHAHPRASGLPRARGRGRPGSRR